MYCEQYLLLVEYLHSTHFLVDTEVRPTARLPRLRSWHKGIASFTEVNNRLLNIHLNLGNTNPSHSLEFLQLLQFRYTTTSDFAPLLLLQLHTNLRNQLHHINLTAAATFDCLSPSLYSGEAGFVTLFQHII